MEVRNIENKLEMINCQLASQQHSIEFTHNTNHSLKREIIKLNEELIVERDCIVQGL